MEEKVIASFHRGIQAKMAVGEALAPCIARAAKRIATTFLNNGKLLVTGVGVGRYLAGSLHHGVAHGFRFARPALPTMLLSDYIDPNIPDGDLIGLQVRALAQPDDCLALISPGSAPASLSGALRAAHSRDIPCILFSGPGDDRMTVELDAADIELSPATDNQVHAQEIHLSAIFCLCELIEHHLFGGSAT
jgi:D-sedoheptulose 7-phosphate isomerase